MRNILATMYSVLTVSLCVLLILGIVPPSNYMYILIIVGVVLLYRYAIIKPKADGSFIINTNDVEKDTITIAYNRHPLDMVDQKVVTFEVEKR